MWWPSGWPLIPSRLFSHLHLLVAAQAGLEFVCVFGHDGLEQAGFAGQRDVEIINAGVTRTGRHWATAWLRRR